MPPIHLSNHPIMNLGASIFKFVQKADNKKQKALWLLPFVGFATGYVLSGFFLHKTDFATPNIIGKPLHESVQILSQNHLGIRLLLQREDATLPEGTILDQLPRPDQKIRSNQHVFVTVSTKQQPIQVPDFWGKKNQEVMEMVTKKELDAQIVLVKADYPAGLCVAQLPSQGTVLNNKKVTLYFSDGKHGASIMPNLKGYLLSSVQEALSKYDIRAEIFHHQQPPPDHICSTCKIIDQQPAPGSIIDVRHGLQFQLKVISQP